ncbi:hypothetical protein Tco_0788343 [Tanacetum coccineum]
MIFYPNTDPRVKKNPGLSVKERMRKKMRSMTDDDTIGEEQGDEDNRELYRDLNINLSRSDAKMTDAQTNPETEEAHVTLTTEPPAVQLQSSFASSDLVAKFINPSPDTGIVDKYLTTKVKDTVDVVVPLKSDKLREEA